MKKNFLLRVLKSKLYLALFLIAFTSQLHAQISIPDDFGGQNLWMPFEIGNRPTPLNGQLEQKYTELNESGAETFRFGGADVEEYVNYDHRQTDYVTKINEVFAFRPNARFVLQLPFKISNLAPLDPNGDPYPLDLEGAALQAKDIVSHVMAHVSTLSPQPKIMWMISNEPDHPDALNYTGYAGAQLIRNYVKRFSERIREADVVSPIIAPGLTNFRNYDGMIDALTDPTDISTNILPYITHFSFHYYPFNHQAKYDACVMAPTRQNVVNCLTQTTFTAGPCFMGNPVSVTPLSSNLQYLKDRIANSGNPNVKMAITETNICYGNDVGDPVYNYVSTGGSSTNQTDDLVTGNGANSYIAGQFYAQLTGICLEKGVDLLCMWSTIEGNNNFDPDPTISLNKGNIGFIDNVNGKKKSSYYHYRMFNGMNGNHHTGTYNHNGVTQVPTYTSGVKTFGWVYSGTPGPGFKVMVINQNDQDFDFRINFNQTSVNTSPTGSNILLNFISISNDISVSSTMNVFYYPQTGDAYSTLQARSTAVLTFDCHGTFVSRINYTQQNAMDDEEPALIQFGGVDVNSPVALCQSGGIGGTITGNTTFTNDTVFVSSNLLLAGNTTLTFNNSVVIMAPNTSIKATPLASIEIKNSKIFGCDGKKWEGIEMIGNYQNGERLLIENSFIVNAKKPVKADKIPDLKILNSVFANGETAIELDRSQAFTISGNIIGGFEKGVKTSNTKKDYPSYIRENRFIEVVTNVEFKDDLHNMLEITCNEFRYKDRAIKSRDTNLKEQGTATLSAGNKFIKDPGQPENYIDHTGSATKYFFGPSESNEFSYPNVMNIPKIQSVADKVCLQLFADNCPSFPNGVEEEKIQPTSQMLIYPNPNNGTFTVLLTNAFKGEANLTVTDILGKVISKQKVNSNSQIFSLDTKAKGLYLVALETEGERITQKIIVE